MLIPLSQLVALEFTSPIWVAALAPAGRRRDIHSPPLMDRASGLQRYFLIVAQPGVQPLSSGHLAGVLCAIAFAMNLLLDQTHHAS